jgi:hypothetical protein
MGVGRIALFSVAVFALHGCSYLFVTTVPENHRRDDAVECTTSRVAPIVDTVMAASHLAGFVYLESRSFPDQDRQQVTLLSVSELAGLLIYGASAVHGYLATADCAEAVASSAREPGGLILKSH